MGLFSPAQEAEIQKIAARSRQTLQQPKKTVSKKNSNTQLAELSKQVVEYFHDSNAILIESKEQLHEYVTNLIDSGYCAIDTETTGLDRAKDYIVGSSLYYPGGTECYIPNKHIIPLFEVPYKNQLTYDDCHEEFQRIIDANVKCVFANADFDLAMLYKDYKTDFNDVCYFDVLIAARCLKENELHANLKALYSKYVLRGEGDPKRFNDFFTPTLFPYCKPQVAKLYAANDAKITFELFQWQLPYLTKSHPKCQRQHLEHIADIVWNLEFPLIKVCQNMHRWGMYVDPYVASKLKIRYSSQYDAEMQKLKDIVKHLLESHMPYVPPNAPFRTADQFNPSSPKHVEFLLYDVLKLEPVGNKRGTGKEVLHEYNIPVTQQILKVRSLSVLINTFVDKLPNAVFSDGRIHANFRQLGADTGRLSCESPNLMNIPSHAVDIRHMFRATPSIEKEVKVSGNTVALSKFDSVKTDYGLKYVEDLCVDDSVYFNTTEGDTFTRNILHMETTGRTDVILTFSPTEYSEEDLRLYVKTASYVMMSSDYS